MYTSPMERKMIDIHMHLIPGVDDGAQHIMESLLLIQRASDEGIGAIFATPHSSAFDHSVKQVEAAFDQMADLAAECIEPAVKLYYGCEVYCEPYQMEEILKSLSSGKYPTMNGTKYVLMEFPHRIRAEDTLPCVEALIKAGWKPVIAHMERYQYLRDNMELVDAFREKGAWIQVNTYSLFEELETPIRDWARQLVKAEKVDFLGTDAHRTNHRSPTAQRGLEWLYANVKSEYADAIVWGNARERFCVT